MPVTGRRRHLEARRCPHRPRAAHLVGRDRFDVLDERITLVAASPAMWGRRRHESLCGDTNSARPLAIRLPVQPPADFDGPAYDRALGFLTGGPVGHHGLPVLGRPAAGSTTATWGPGQARALSAHAGPHHPSDARLVRRPNQQLALAHAEARVAVAGSSQALLSWPQRVHRGDPPGSTVGPVVDAEARSDDVPDHRRLRAWSAIAEQRCDVGESERATCVDDRGDHPDGGA